MARLVASLMSLLVAVLVGSRSELSPFSFSEPVSQRVGQALSARSVYTPAKWPGGAARGLAGRLHHDNWHRPPTTAAGQPPMTWVVYADNLISLHS
jgi:hypothetical protein